LEPFENRVVSVGGVPIAPPLRRGERVPRRWAGREPPATSASAISREVCEMRANRAGLKLRSVARQRPPLRRVVTFYRILYRNNWTRSLLFAKGGADFLKRDCES
jgi:hypothetical protein